ncbi:MULTISPECIES: TcmI family type II polyketide cyclase [Streptomyces]|uniref:TcmI family type II polyketide cyclase n=1 Tax=Streptomyces lonegramiae TaxID=3075524 RepID=A0ABU2XQP3_9ACTN|nr:TcmI family type II polyketide cyclase [Streptomyces sp. DSM 41529]MDT0547815.1 TcmI family type II polyketide cyclase [Streptomyces sp. DSM 41529]
MYRTMIVAKMNRDAGPDIAKVFAHSDQGELPKLIGVTGRSLFQFGDVYLHLIEADRPPAEQVARYVKHPEFRDVSERLQPFVQAYDPETWREPKDAMAHEFYRWERDRA